MPRGGSKLHHLRARSLHALHASPREGIGGRFRFVRTLKCYARQGGTFRKRPGFKLLHLTPQKHAGNLIPPRECVRPNPHHAEARSAHRDQLALSVARHNETRWQTHFPREMFCRCHRRGGAARPIDAIPNAIHPVEILARDTRFLQPPLLRG